MSIASPSVNGSSRLKSVASQPVSSSLKLKMPKPDRVLFLAASGMPWLLAIILLMVSMPHLATGFQNITHSSSLASWLLAVAFDCTQVVAKLQLTLLKQYRVSTGTWLTSLSIIIGTTVMSMSLNTLAFLAGATDRTGTFLSVIAGIMIPLLILGLSFTGSSFALAKTVVTPKK